MRVRALRRLAGICAILLAAVALAAAPLPEPEPGKLSVYFLDVGQGDAALIVGPTGKTILVDGGPSGAAGTTVEKIRAVTSQPLDLVILTHPHLDHLGGLPRALGVIGAARYMDPGVDHSTSAYRDLLRVVADLDIEYVEPTAPADGSWRSFGIGGDARVEIFWPRRPLEPLLRGTRSDVNSNSIVLRVRFGTTSFLFTGDIESETETVLLRSGAPLDATVLKVAHHGSASSSQTNFLAQVAARAAVISCGAGNAYGHPDPATLARLAAAGARVFRTDMIGDIRAVSDGTTVHMDAPRSSLALGAFRGDAETDSDLTFQHQDPALPVPARLTSPKPPECCKRCTKGQPCGDTCISMNKTCHVGPGCACR
jgi:competence protein ComEC